MKIAIIGQQDFGKAVLDAFLARGDEVAGVFCAPEKPGAKADPVRAAAEEKKLKVFQFKSLREPDAHDALKSLNVDLGIMAYGPGKLSLDALLDRQTKLAPSNQS